MSKVVVSFLFRKKEPLPLVVRAKVLAICIGIGLLPNLAETLKYVSKADIAECWLVQLESGVLMASEVEPQAFLVRLVHSVRSARH